MAPYSRDTMVDEAPWGFLTSRLSQGIFLRAKRYVRKDWELILYEQGSMNRSHAACAHEAPLTGDRGL